uniref:N5-glutamine methyltransferase family protein n=1 Tax=Senegalimassilia anaerobia TaxID=1473216 RepID=UPI003AB9A9FC
GVLIPRPETEVLVSEALSLLPAAHRRVALDSTIDAWEGDALIAAEAAAAEAAQDGSGDASETLKRSQQAISAYLDAQQDQGNGESGERPDGSAVAKPRPLLVADICTGSGCIACSVAYERPDTRVIATDIAPEAVALAKDNARELGLSDRVRIEQGDLGSPVPAAAMGRLDLVVSNPPYVPTAVLAEIPREVADFEPALALDGGADGNDILRRLLPWTAAALRPGGGFAFELHETCLDAAAELARRAGFHQVRIVDDLAGRPRVLTGVKPV